MSEELTLADIDDMIEQLKAAGLFPEYVYDYRKCKGLQMQQVANANGCKVSQHLTLPPMLHNSDSANQLLRKC